MTRWIVGSSLRFRFLVLAAAAAMVIFGVTRLHDVRVDVFPEFAPPLVEIQTEGPGMSSAEVEELITIPMEETLTGTPELDVMRSKSVTALSSIRLIFKHGTDLLHARQLVQERLDLAKRDLPASAGMPVMLQPLSATSRVMKIGLSSTAYSLTDLSMIAYWTIRFRLLGVPGVANVAIWGERIKMLTVQVDPERLRTDDVSLNEVEKATSEALDFGLLRYSTAAKTRTDGFIDTPNQRLNIKHVLPVFGPDDLARIPLKVSNGAALRLGDVARVVWDTWPLIGDAVVNDGPGLLLIVEKLPWANTLEVTRGVEAALEALRPGLPGIEIDTHIFRPATFIEMAIENLTRAMLLGALLVVLVLGAFLYEWRVAVISCVAIPLSLVAAGLVLYLRDATMNTMVLAGFVIALGAVVDDAIIDIENVVRRLRQHRKELSTNEDNTLRRAQGERNSLFRWITKPLVLSLLKHDSGGHGQSRQQGRDTAIARIILEASVEVRGAVVYATLIEVVALLPVFLMEGLSGAFFRPLAFSYALAVLASMLVALTVTPALGLILLRNVPLEQRESPLVPWVQRQYDRILSRVIRAPWGVYAVVAIIVVAGCAVWPRLGHSLLPAFKERDFLMHWVTKPGTSRSEMYRITAAVSRELRSVPGVRNFGAHIGRALAADEVVGVNFTENWVSVDPSADYDTTVARIQAVVDGYPGVYRDVQTYLKERIKEVLTGGHESILVRIFGPELTDLRRQAEAVRQALAGIDGLVDLHVELQADVPQVEVKVDLAKAERYGLKPGDVRRAAATIMSGIEVSDIHRDGKVYDVQVWSIPEARQSLTSIRELLIDAPSGGYVRLGDVADVRISPTPNAIQREGVSRRIDVGANVGGRDLGSVVADVERRLKDVEFPLGYYPELLGEYAERRVAQQRMRGFVAAGAIGIFFLLLTSFGSWRLATLSFLTLPSALIGGVLAAWAGDGIISLGSLVGFLTVLGIAARNGVMLISHYQHLERHEGEAFGPELILRGARERISPILMTALTTGLALVPLVIAGNIPGHEIEHPMAVVILGGLVTSTLLNLFVVPSLYLRFGRA